MKFKFPPGFGAFFRQAFEFKIIITENIPFSCLIHCAIKTNEMSQRYFNKKFSFKCSERQLPDDSVFFSTDDGRKHEGLQIIKSILNHVKSKLNDMIIEEWSLHTRQRNPAQQILHYLKSEIRAEFVTQAFAKFFECVSAYPMVANVKGVFQSVHLCEAPGAFICSLNHYLKIHHPDVEVSLAFAI